MADVAAIFHWPPDVMDAMTLPELMDWRALAVERWQQMNGAGD
jgi:hypothetical protein